MNWNLKFKSSTTPIVILLVLTGLLLTACDGTGGAKAKTVTIGVLNLTSALEPSVAGFKEGLAELDYVEGENVTYIYEGPVGSVDKLDAAAQELVAADVDLILSITTPATQAAQRATADTGIPVVFLPLTDPVAAGVVQSLREPGGNLTGVTSGGSEPRRLEFQVRLAPEVKKVYSPYNPDGSSTVSLATTEAAAATLNVELVPQVATTPDEVVKALETMPEDADAIFVLSDGFMESQIDTLIEAAVERDIPLSSTNLQLVENGVLFSYGFHAHRVGQQTARIANQILQGASPANLPVETADFFLAVNLQTAEAIGLNVPEAILRQAEFIVR